MKLQQICSLAWAITLLLGSSLLGQIPYQTTYTGDSAVHPFVESPLEAGFGVKRTRLGESAELVTHHIDISSAVAKYADLKQVDLPQARFDALEYLGATSGHPNGAAGVAGTQAKFRPIRADKFEVTAPASYFESLPSRIRSFELGKKSIVISIDYIQLDDAVQNEVKKFLVADSVEHISGKIPSVSTEVSNERTGKYQASSNLRVSKSMPLTVGQLTNDNYNRLMKLVRSRKNCEVVSSPTVVAHPGQDAMIHDGALRPFVVGLSQIVGDFTQATQPTVQCVEEGNFCKVNCDITDGTVTMGCNLSIAKITDIDTLQLRNSELPGHQMVQTPSQQVRAVSIITELDHDRVLMLDPYHTSVVERDVNGKIQQVDQHLITLIRVKVIDSN